MTRTIYRERLPQHPKLGRNVNFDSESIRYAVQPRNVVIGNVRHEQSIGILDQGDIGSCTGNASVSCAYHEPFYAFGGRSWVYTADEIGARNWYHDNTANDGYDGTWQPDDTGSDGLTSSKMAVAAGIASGYQAALDLDSSLQTLMDRPGITGIPWYNSMFDAPSSGLLTVDPKSGLAGGHELCVDEIVTADAPGNGTGVLLVGGPNSWNLSWGAQGRWYLRATDWWDLRKRQGDVYFWVAKSQPAPTPAPVPGPPVDPDSLTLWNQTRPFRHDHHVAPHIKAASHALKVWGEKLGLADV